MCCIYGQIHSKHTGSQCGDMISFFLPPTEVSLKLFVNEIHIDIFTD